VNRTILVVEDDADDAHLIQRAFARAYPQAHLHRVDDGDAAIAYLEHAATFNSAANPVPDLMLLDLKLPLRNGFEVLEWTRAKHAHRTLPIVVLTGYGHAGDVKRAYELGANSYLVKPVSAKALQALAAVVGLYWLEHNHSAIRP
jgi:CheY-like chemotaxis protein